MKLVILILANDTKFYLECQKLWRMYMNTHPNIKSYFIKYKSNLNQDVALENDNIFIKGTESMIPGCLDKTIKAINFCLQTQTFDFIFRTNMSSVVDLNRLNDLIENYNMPYSGYIGHENIKGIDGIIDYASGSGMLLSKPFCMFLMHHKNKLNYRLIDDMSIGLLCQQNGVQLYPLTRFETYTYEPDLTSISKELIKDYYHFRCKAKESDVNTLIMLKTIINLIYYQT